MGQAVKADMCASESVADWIGKRWEQYLEGICISWDQ